MIQLRLSIHKDNLEQFKKLLNKWQNDKRVINYKYLDDRIAFGEIFQINFSDGLAVWQCAREFDNPIFKS